MPCDTFFRLWHVLLGLYLLEAEGHFANELEAGLRLEEDSCSNSACWLQRRAKRQSENSREEHAIETNSSNIAKVNTNASSEFYCDSHTGGSCRFWSCSSTRGPTMCKSSQCRCKPGFCAVNGICMERTAHVTDTCNRRTGGSCRFLGCSSWRGAVDCIDGACVCQAGYCSADDGSCHKPKPRIKAKVVPVNLQSQVFPAAQVNLRTGVCFSGGGSRALTVTMGVLRALESLKLIPHIDAISSVSGGTWASSIYMFAKDVSIKDLLGEDTTPNELTMEKLFRKPARLGDVATTSITSLLLSKVMTLNGGSNPHDLWIESYAKTVLEPFGLANRSQFMAANEESLRSILQRNPSLQREQFQVPNPLRPKTFIMGGTLLAPVGLVATETSAVSLQMSPDFTGSPFYPKDSLVHYKGGQSDREFLVGGGFVESFAFGGSSPLSAQGQMGGDAVEMEAPPTSFSLADAIGISSAAFASVLVSADWLTSAASFFIGHQAEEYLPVKDVWPVTSERFSAWRSALKYQLGDGAEVDNTGMMPLLQRKVSKILVVDSTNVELSEDIDFCTANVLGLSLKGKVSNDLLDKFGYAAENPGEYLIYNQVFHADELQPLLCEFQKKRMAGDAMVVQRDLEVLANSKWGIEGNWRVSVVFAYLSSPRRFTVNLPPETLQEVEKGSSGKFANWPHFKTSSQNGPTKFTSYTREQVNLLAALGEYMVRSNTDLFMRFFL
ncbi:unnamed protein product [Durusdinium trenchii]|uniref:PNPLA domain-containing protein n=1 Tax=Durusdinium trenchii TaxID=1381693 RepID=A0ABP0HE27_9DINO